MKLTHQLVLERSREEVWKAFDTPANLSKWQPTLRSFTHQTGAEGQPGAVSELTYEENGRSIVLIETIVVRRELEEFSGTYDNAQATNMVRNTFTAVEAGRTAWLMESEFHFKGVVFRLLAPFVKGLIDRRIRTDMERFKRLLEQGQL